MKIRKINFLISIFITIFTVVTELIKAKDMKESLRMLIMSQLSDAQFQIEAGNIEDANWLINAVKVMLREFSDKEVEFDDIAQKVTKVIGNR